MSSPTTNGSALLKQALAPNRMVRVSLHQGGAGIVLTTGAAELQVAEGPCAVVISGLEPESTDEDYDFDEQETGGAPKEGGYEG